MPRLSFQSNSSDISRFMFFFQFCVISVLTLRDDLMAETKRAIYSELETLRSENSSMKERLLKLAAEKKKAEEKSTNRLNESQIGVPVGERTMASCVQSSTEYKQLESM